MTLFLSLLHHLSPGGRPPPASVASYAPCPRLAPRRHMCMHATAGQHTSSSFPRSLSTRGCERCRACAPRTLAVVCGACVLQPACQPAAHTSSPRSLSASGRERCKAPAPPRSLAIICGACVLRPVGGTYLCLSLLMGVARLRSCPRLAPRRPRLARALLPPAQGRRCRHRLL
jgi:hypothetical protein